MDYGQFEHLVGLATEEVQEQGLAASPQAVTIFVAGALDRRFAARVIRFDGKLVGAIVLAVGIIIGNLGGKI